MKTFKTRTVHFVFSLRTFVSAHVIITSITALGMSINLSLVVLLLLAGSLVFEILLSINGKKAGKKSWERSDIPIWQMA